MDPLLATDGFEHIIMTIVHKGSGKILTVTGMIGIEANRISGKYKDDIKISSDNTVVVRTLQAGYRAGFFNLVLSHHSEAIDFLIELDADDPRNDLVSVSVVDTLARKKWSAETAWQSGFASAKLEVEKGDRTFAFRSPVLKMDQHI